MKKVSDRLSASGKSINKNLIIAPLGLVALVLVFTFTSKYFFSFDNFVNILRQASINMIIAVGMTIVILTGGIDLSVGSIVALGACSMAQLNLTVGMNIWVSVLIGIVIAILLGTINGLIVWYGRIPPFIATLGMMGMARGGALIITHGYASKSFGPEFRWIGNGSVLGIPYMFMIAIAVLLGAVVLLKWTALGKYFYAIGGNEEAATYSGINIKMVKISAYVILGFCCGVAATVMASRVNSAPPSAGTGYELNAIAAVVIGGTSLSGGEGSVGGSMLGALIMAVLTNGLNLLNVDTNYQTALIGAVIIIMVYIKNISESKINA